MSAKPVKKEDPYMSRIGWLRAAVLGANDGVISVASLIAGVAASQSDRNTILLTGVAAMVSGALSMAAGEYVSVSSQSDTEKSEISRERKALKAWPAEEKEELTSIYVGRGLTRKLAEEVSDQFSAQNALAAHSRDELGIFAQNEAKPIQAALTSAVTFSSGAIIPIVVLMITPRAWIVWTVSVSAILILAVLGAAAAVTGGANIPYSIFRVTFWGALALMVTAGVGHLFGIVT